MDLTAEQQAAVAHQLAHARIVAVAGAGKTATLTHYVAARLEAVDAGRVLILMYNRAAQQAFSQRLRQLCAQPVLPQVRTFHSLGLRIYKRLISEGWLPSKNLQPLPDITVELQLKQQLQRSTKAAQLIDTNEQLQEWVDLSRQFITLVKSATDPATAVVANLALNKGADEVLLEAFTTFEAWRSRQGVITYDDMLYDPAMTFAQQPESAQMFSDGFDEILVDEYQDINPIQHFLLRVIAGTRAQVMVIGDPDQTIYEFRGSSPEFITKLFARDFAAPETYCLTRTFRFGHALALCANQLISHNRMREPILTISGPSTPHSRVHLAQCDHHGRKIVKAVMQLHANGGAYSGMAVLCRLWSYARPVELELMSAGIPYRIDGEQSILQCAEIRPFLHALDLMSGELATQSLEQRQQKLFELLATPPLKIPHTLLRRISSVWANTVAESPLPQSFLKSLPPNVKPYQQRMFDLLTAALRQLAKPLPCAKALQNYAEILDYGRRLQEGALNPEKGQEQARTVAAFLQFAAAAPAQTACELRQLLAQMHDQQSYSAMDAVTLTTIHRSKGLEWPVVFLPNMAEGHLPCTPGGERQRLENERCRIESERRLMYVAITRAQKQLFITVPQDRSSATASRFIEEMQIPASQTIAEAVYRQAQEVVLEQAPRPAVEQYLAQLQSPPRLIIHPPPAAEKNSRARTATNPGKWRTGDRVEHAILGLGHIQSLEDKRIRIAFDDGKARTFVEDLAQPHLSRV